MAEKMVIIRSFDKKGTYYALLHVTNMLLLHAIYPDFFNSSYIHSDKEDLSKILHAHSSAEWNILTCKVAETLGSEKGKSN